jgi:hypothetical protein
MLKPAAGGLHTFGRERPSDGFDFWADFLEPM